MIYFTAPHRDHWFDWNWPLPFTDIHEQATYWICNPSENFIISNIHLDLMPNLKAIITPSTGTNHINVAACEKRGVKVLSLLDDRVGLNEIRASSEFTFQLILHALHRPFQQWKMYMRDDDVMRGRELCGKYVGIVGYGRIGKNIAKWCKAFGADWDYYDVYCKKNKIYKLFKNCDIVVLSLSLTKETVDFITKEHLELMKPGAILVNTARAEVVKEQDLVEWAKKGQQCYAADVLHGEVTGHHVNSELLHLGNCIITPHIAGTTYESQEKAARIALKLLRNEVNG